VKIASKAVCKAAMEVLAKFPCKYCGELRTRVRDHHCPPQLSQAQRDQLAADRVFLAQMGL